MSLFRPTNLVCPNCKTLITMPAVGSVNADRRPDFRDAILNDSFQDTTCGNCNETFRLQPRFNYLDAGRSQWIAGLPANRMPDYLDVETEVTDLFATSYGSKAPKAAQVVGDKLDVRITFGWPALREKLFAREQGLDDVALELLKLDMIRRMDKAPMAPGTELRLIGIEGDQLVFMWIDAITEEKGIGYMVERAAYESIVAKPDVWKKTREKLQNGPFVDMQKLYMGEGRTA